MGGLQEGGEAYRGVLHGGWGEHWGGVLQLAYLCHEGTHLWLGLSMLDTGLAGHRSR